MTPLAEACAALLARIDGSLACAVVDGASPRVLGEAALATGVPAETAPAVAALLTGAASRRVAALAGGAAFEEVHVRAGGLGHFARVLAGGSAVLVVTTDVDERIGRIWALVRAEASALAALLPDSGAGAADQ